MKIIFQEASEVSYKADDLEFIASTGLDKPNVEIMELLPEIKEVLRNILFDYHSVIIFSMAKEDIEHANVVFRKLQELLKMIQL